MIRCVCSTTLCSALFFLPAVGVNDHKIYCFCVNLMSILHSQWKCGSWYPYCICLSSYCQWLSYSICYAFCSRRVPPRWPSHLWSRTWGLYEISIWPQYLPKLELPKPIPHFNTDTGNKGFPGPDFDFLLQDYLKIIFQFSNFWKMVLNFEMI